MNKLEEYRDKLWTDFISSEESFGVEHDEAFEKGFDAVIALDLPVKFEKWKLEEGITYYRDDGIIGYPNSYFRRDNHSMDIETPEELYKYWVENIFKIE